MNSFSRKILAVPLSLRCYDDLLRRSTVTVRCVINQTNFLYVALLASALDFLNFLSNMISFVKVEVEKEVFRTEVKEAGEKKLTGLAESIAGKTLKLERTHLAG